MVVSIRRRVAGTIAAVFLLSGCGGLRPSAGEPTAVLQNEPHESSTSAESLLYFTDHDAVLMYALPGLDKLATFDQGTQPSGVCVDSEQHVYIAGKYGIQEYAHGGTTPIAEFGTSYEVSMPSCSVDPTTGNFAAVDATKSGVLIWQDRSSSPTYYKLPYFQPRGCAYDSNGDLFVTGSASPGGSNVIELAVGATSFTEISLDHHLVNPRTIQWLGSYFVTIASLNDADFNLYKLTVSGSTASVQKLPIGRTWPGFWIDGNTAVTPYGRPRRPGGANIAIYDFPDGKRPRRKVTVQDDGFYIQAMVVSQGSR